MNFKKFLSMSLSIAMAFSMVACGSKTETTTNDVIDVAIDKQAMYEEYFANGEAKTVGNSMTVESKVEDEDFKMDLLFAKDGSAKIGMSSNEADILTFFVDADGVIYIDGTTLGKLAETEEEAKAVSNWYKYSGGTIKTEELIETLGEDENYITDFTSVIDENYITDFTSVKNVKYLETIDGKDYVLVTIDNSEEVEITERTIEFEKDGDTVTTVVLTTADNEYKFVEPEYEGYQYITLWNGLVGPDLCDIPSTEISTETRMGVFEESTIELKLCIDVETKLIEGYNCEIDGEEGKITFVDCEAIDFEVPFDCVELNEEDFGTVVFLLLMANADSNVRILY